jgi:FAD-dependent urate hydroxylase
METYRVYNGHGELIHEYDLGALAGRIGPIRQLTRAELLTLLREGADRADLRMATTLEAARPEGDAIAVRLSDGTETSVDLLVGADGIHSQIRRDFFAEAATHSSGWGAWVWWADKALVRHDTIAEYWGAGRFVGAHPTRDRIGLIAGGSEARLGPAAIGEHTAALRRELAGLGDSVALLGDSACGFLPTAGIGASMAMESAAVLADELDRTDAKFLPKALALYEKRRRKRAEAAQDDSRHLGSMMFVDSLPLAWGRDQLLKFYSLEMLAKQIAKSLDEPI